MVLSFEQRLFAVAIAAERMVYWNIKTFFQYQFFRCNAMLYINRLAVKKEADECLKESLLKSEYSVELPYA